MPFPIWQSIPPTTTVRDLYRTSLLACTDEPGSGVLLRCSPGLEDGTTNVVHARASRPDALRMTGIDDDTQIDAQARLLLGASKVHVVAIPHITWKSLGGGLPWRIPFAAAIGVLSAVLMYVSPLSLSTWVPVTVAAGLGLLMWLLLRERTPTRIGSPGAPPMTADAVVERALLSLNGPSRNESAATGPHESTPRWAPHVR